MTYLISTNEENWTCSAEYATREEAVAAAAHELDLLTGERFYSGVKGPPTLVTPNAEHAIDEVTNTTCEHDGTPAEDWIENPSVKEVGALQTLLDEAWAKWLEMFPNHKPEWWMVTDIQDHRAP